MYKKTLSVTIWGVKSVYLNTGGKGGYFLRVLFIFYSLFSFLIDSSTGNKNVYQKVYSRKVLLSVVVFIITIK
jgi:hypothetical protein